jgi:hypothetical protein
MDREASTYRLTDQQLTALDILSMDCGFTNQELTEWLRKKKGNIHNKVTKPLLEKGLIYQIGKIYPKPNKKLYINKCFKIINKIRHDLADPIEGRIWYYEKIHYSEQKEYEKRKWDCIRNQKELPPISDKHLQARTFLLSFIHLQLWCDKSIDEMQSLLRESYVRGSFCLLTPIPPCALCQDIQKHAKSQEYLQEHQRIIWERDQLLAIMRAQTEHGINDVRELEITHLRNSPSII